MLELNENLLKKLDGVIAKSLERVAKKLYKENPEEAKNFVEESRSRVKGTTDLKTAVQDSDLVVEAIVENMKVKHELFKNLDNAAPQKTIFASNTSSLSITEIASVRRYYVITSYQTFVRYAILLAFPTLDFIHEQIILIFSKP